MPAPIRANRGACSYTLTSMPIWRRVAAAAIPPIPAPTMPIESFLPLILRSHSQLETLITSNYRSFSWRRRHNTSRYRTRFALNLRAVHHSTRACIEWIAPVHGAAVVPQDEVADVPFVLPFEYLAIGL